MKQKHVNRLLIAERAGLMLTMRHAVLTDNQEWLQKPTMTAIPPVVFHILENVCSGCLIKAMTAGEWSGIDKWLLGEESPRASGHLH